MAKSVLTDISEIEESTSSFYSREREDREKRDIFILTKSTKTTLTLEKIAMAEKHDEMDMSSDPSQWKMAEDQDPNFRHFPAKMEKQEPDTPPANIHRDAVENEDPRPALTAPVSPKLAASPHRSKTTYPLPLPTTPQEETMSDVRSKRVAIGWTPPEEENKVQHPDKLEENPPVKPKEPTEPVTPPVKSKPSANKEKTRATTKTQETSKQEVKNHQKSVLTQLSHDIVKMEEYSCENKTDSGGKSITEVRGFEGYNRRSKSESSVTTGQTSTADTLDPVDELISKCGTARVGEYRKRHYSESGVCIHTTQIKHLEASPGQSSETTKQTKGSEAKPRQSTETTPKTKGSEARPRESSKTTTQTKVLEARPRSSTETTTKPKSTAETSQCQSSATDEQTEGMEVNPCQLSVTDKEDTLLAVIAIIIVVTLLVCDFLISY